MKNTCCRIGAGALVLILTLGLIGIPVPSVQALKKVDGGADCVYDGKTYGEGSVIVAADGHRYRCEKGAWVYLDIARGPRTNLPKAAR